MLKTAKLKMGEHPLVKIKWNTYMKRIKLNRMATKVKDELLSRQRTSW